MGRGAFHRHGLRAALLFIHFGSSKTGQEIGDLAVDHMAAIELGGDLDGQAKLSPARLDGLGIRDGAQEVAAEADKGTRLPLDNRLAGVDRRSPLRTWRLELIEL